MINGVGIVLLYFDKTNICINIKDYGYTDISSGHMGIDINGIIPWDGTKKTF